MITTLRARPLPGSLDGLTLSPFERIGLDVLLVREEEEGEESKRVGMMRAMFERSPPPLTSYLRHARTQVPVVGRSPQRAGI